LLPNPCFGIRKFSVSFILFSLGNPTKMGFFLLFFI
jgi:hypothetical protein